MAKYCKACGHTLDESGICTNENCKRHKLQTDAKTKKEAADKAKTTAEKKRTTAKTKSLKAFLKADKAKAAVFKTK